MSTPKADSVRVRSKDVHYPPCVYGSDAAVDRVVMDGGLSVGDAAAIKGFAAFLRVAGKPGEPVSPDRYAQQAATLSRYDLDPATAAAMYERLHLIGWSWCEGEAR